MGSVGRRGRLVVSAFDSFLDFHGNVLDMICILALRFFLSFQRKFLDALVENKPLEILSFWL